MDAQSAEKLMKEIESYAMGAQQLEIQSTPTDTSIKYQPLIEKIPVIETIESEETVTRGGDNDLTHRFTITKAKGIGKVNRLLETFDQWLLCNGDRTLLTEPARNFLQTSLIPFQLCFSNHFINDKDSFIIKLGESFTHTRFGSKRCSGRQDCKL